MRPLIRKLLPLVGLCWLGMAIAGDVEHQELRCCIPEVNCPTEGWVAGRSGKFMRVSVKAVRDGVTGRVIELPADKAQYVRLLNEALTWKQPSVMEAITASVLINVKCEGHETSDLLQERESVLCSLGKGATFEQSDPECEDPATGTTVILQIEYLSKDELLQEFSELQARKAALDQRAEELNANIANRKQEIADSFDVAFGNKNSAGNSSTTETNNYENLPINNSSASWNWKHWLKHLPVSVSSASGGELGAWQNSGVGLAE